MLAARDRSMKWLTVVIAALACASPATTGGVTCSAGGYAFDPNLIGGNNQVGGVESTLNPVSVRLICPGLGNSSIEDAQIKWTVTAGGGSVSQSSVLTSSSGGAGTVWTLGSPIGIHTLEASFTEPGTTTTYKSIFTATAYGLLNITQGDAQSGNTGAPLPQYLEVRYVDGNLSPLAGQDVSWTVPDDGSVSAALTQTNATGYASVNWTLGSSAGPQTLTASLVGLPGGATSSVTFNATAGDPCPIAAGTQHSGTITTSELWTLATSPHHVQLAVTYDGAGTVLTIEPGVTVCAHQIILQNGARILAQGLATPIGAIVFRPEAFGTIWNGIQLYGPSSDTSRFDNVLLDRGSLASSSLHPVVVEDSRLRRSRLELLSPGSRFVRSTVDTAPVGPLGYAVQLSGNIGDPPIEFEGRVRGSEGTGVYIQLGAVTLSNCEITKSFGDGIYIQNDTPDITINGCNIFDNGDNGVVNAGASVTIDAMGNWWGDALGPTGPNGDGISALVDAANHLTSPLIFNYTHPAPERLAAGRVMRRP